MALNYFTDITLHQGNAMCTELVDSDNTTSLAHALRLAATNTMKKTPENRGGENGWDWTLFILQQMGREGGGVISSLPHFHVFS